MRRLILFGILCFIFIGIVLIFLTGPQIGPGTADYSYRIAENCTLDRSSAEHITISCEGIDKNISAKVMNVGWNGQYVVANTHPLTMADPNNPNCKECAPDETITYWWVQDLVNKQAYGPMSQADFFKLGDELGIREIQLFPINEAKAKGAWIYGDGREN